MIVRKFPFRMKINGFPKISFVGHFGGISIADLRGESWGRRYNEVRYPITVCRLPEYASDIFDYRDCCADSVTKLTRDALLNMISPGLNFNLAGIGKRRQRIGLE